MFQLSGSSGRHRSSVRRRGVAVAAGWVWAGMYTLASTVVVYAGLVVGHDPIRWMQP